MYVADISYTKGVQGISKNYYVTIIFGVNWISKENRMLTLKRVSRRRAIINDYNIVDLCIVTITDVYKNVNNAFDNCIQNSYVCICS